VSTGAKAAAGEPSLFDRLLHDLRNPVGVMAYYAETIPAAGPTERDEMFERLRVNAQRALHVLEEFSLLAELRAGRCRIEPEPCDLAELVAELAAELAALERRPACIRSAVQVTAPIGAARAHVLCAVRALLRVALRVTAAEDTVDLAVRRSGTQVLFTITTALRQKQAFCIRHGQQRCKGVFERRTSVRLRRGEIFDSRKDVFIVPDRSPAFKFGVVGAPDHQTLAGTMVTEIEEATAAQSSRVRCSAVWARSRESSSSRWASTSRRCSFNSASTPLAAMGTPDAAAFNLFLASVSSSSP